MALAGPDGELRFRITDGGNPAGPRRGTPPGRPPPALRRWPSPRAPIPPRTERPSARPSCRSRATRSGSAHDPELFERGTAARLLAHYGTLLADALAHPARPVSRLRLLTDAELRTTLVEWNDTATDLPAEGRARTRPSRHGRTWRPTRWPSYRAPTA
ncbi:hypothetical protein STENM327S_08372 [Streptomyces tendae]